MLTLEMDLREITELYACGQFTGLKEFSDAITECMKRHSAEVQ